MSKKIRLTEKQLRECILKDISQSLFFESKKSEKDISAFAKSNVSDVIDYIMSKAKESGDDSEVIRLAREYGINLDQLRGIISKEEFKQKRNKRVQDVFNNLSNPELRNNTKKEDEISIWVKEYLDTLRKCCQGKNFNKDFDRTTYDKNGELQRDIEGNIVMHNAGDNLKPNNPNSDKISFDAITDPVVKNNVILLKDFLDKLGLTALYREANVPASVAERCGMPREKINKNTPVSELTLDFGNLANSEMLSYFSSRKDKGWLKPYVQDFMKTDLYAGLDNAKTGKTVSNTDILFNEQSGSTILRSLVKNGLTKQRAERYVDRTYGVALEFGADNGMFKFGNTKIHKDTLVVNFQSAFRCPAWNRCIMKDACYAKTSEVGYDDALTSNMKKGFIWEQTKSDPKLMKLMMNVIKACMIDYVSAAPKIFQLAKKNGIDLSIMIGEVEDGREQSKALAKLLVHMSFSLINNSETGPFGEIGPEIINILKKYKNGSLIRLNENGDFIGQWLVDAWEKLAEDFSYVGIYVAAYTCRALNYTKVKNMILNISQANLVKGQGNSHFAHYFYAISHDEYNKLGETYDGSDYSLEIRGDVITPVFRNLLDEQGNLVGYYYKCPCGRGKFEYVPVNRVKQEDGVVIKEYNSVPVCFKDSDMYVKVNGQYYKRTKIKNAITKADCYMCRICYAREAIDNENKVKIEGGAEQNKDLPVFVFVATHGSNSGEFDEDIADARQMLGHDVKYWVNLQNNRNKTTNTEQPAYAVNENEEFNSSDNSGANDDIVMKQITKNFTESVANMMSKTGMKLNEIKANFFKTFNKIKQ